MSTFGRVFRVTTFGESHCKGVGCIVDGVPPRMRLTEADIQPQLSRRRPGQSKLTTKRDEADAVTILSGTEVAFGYGCLDVYTEREQCVETARSVTFRLCNHRHMRHHLLIPIPLSSVCFSWASR